MLCWILYITFKRPYISTFFGSRLLLNSARLQNLHNQKPLSQDCRSFVQKGIFFWSLLVAGPLLHTRVRASQQGNVTCTRPHEFLHKYLIHLVTPLLPNQFIIYPLYVLLLQCHRYTLTRQYIPLQLKCSWGMATWWLVPRPTCSSFIDNIFPYSRGALV